MEKEILEGNKIIASFMGYKYFPFDETQRQWVGDKKDGMLLDQMNGWHRPSLGHYKIDGWYLCRNHNELRYHRDWSWLMTVVEKIRFLGAVDFVISIGGSVVISWDDGTVYYNQNKGMGRNIIETTFESVVEFIKWYNDSSITKK